MNQDQYCTIRCKAQYSKHRGSFKLQPKDQACESFLGKQDPMKKRVVLLLFLIPFIYCAGQIHANRAWSYMNENNYDAAIVEFGMAAQKGDLPGIYLGYFQAYLGKQDFEKAFKYLQDGLNKFPDDGFLNLTAGYYYLRTRDPPDPEKAMPFLVAARKSRLGNAGSSLRKKILGYIDERNNAKKEKSAKTN
jgi:tetratricopeptide (TPR) repeat protein